ncbi:biotin--[acetyl-CoA-carboxylase] ligase [Nocardioides nematodiphilus]|uniref:biotin--[acetyl-CoA-carboxylase] ligase n=1 Tax=Nocardioides nematodiphilus TaxID=2849669 RepID=UPI001CD9230C|nr:biotin--[acetyl-CoA-carboxylase] ligase [Nocardioides nematodiphilus]MCA1983632.1 biotin--[acetyl-CoA-carboxylase] ligase [Nocardioides nematodiphilus]
MSADGMRRPSLQAERLAALAPTWQVEILAETTSTNAVCAQRARDGAPEGLVVTTEHQYAGRGRLDRVWEMPPRAALATSVLLRPTLPPERWTWLPLMAGVAVARTIEGRLKWPNDVLLGPELKKVCGILVERIETPAGPAAVLGIGINTSLTPDELPIPHATSLQIERGEEVDRTGVLVTLLAEIADAYALLVHDPEELSADYLALSATVGMRVRAELPSGGALAGTASGIDPYGRLLITQADGLTQAVGAGDIVHLRPLD